VVVVGGLFSLSAAATVLMFADVTCAASAGGPLPQRGMNAWMYDIYRRL
jgi:hypothetical protein